MAALDSVVLQERAAELREQFQEHLDEVHFISAFQAWIQFVWDTSGETEVKLNGFDRFPKIGDLTPDFLVTFSNGYGLCGELKKRFYDRPTCDEELKQIVSYSTIPAPSLDCKSFDVALFVRAGSDEIAVKAIKSYLNEHGNPRGRSNIAVLEQNFQHGEKEFFVIVFRDMFGNNERFSSPNADKENGAGDLNRIFVGKSHEAIRFDRAARSLATAQPYVHDEPPVVYTYVRVLLPALNLLLTPSERDQINAGDTVEKMVSVNELMATDALGRIVAPDGIKSTRIRRCLDFLVTGGGAKKLKDAEGSYIIKISSSVVSDREDTKKIERFARAGLKLEAGAKARNKSKNKEGQGTLFEE